MTLAQLKRDAASGKIRFEMYERYGETGEAIPPRCRGIRSVKKVNSVAIILLTTDGKESELRFPAANLVDYDGNTLTIYEVGERELTQQEKDVLVDWERRKKEYEEQNPYSDTYWFRKAYFKKCQCPWMDGFETVQGKRYQFNGNVRDNKVRGKAILKYKIHW